MTPKDPVLSCQPMTTGASEAIRIAELFYPEDLIRQRDLAREIIGAINLCEAQFADDIIKSLRTGAALPEPGA